MRSRIAAMARPACLSSRSAQLASWSGEKTSTSCTPLAEACVNTGPRFWTRIGSLPSKIGRASCRDRVCQYVLISVVAFSLQYIFSLFFFFFFLFFFLFFFFFFFFF